jgi:hypothetical protein
VETFKDTKPNETGNQRMTDNTKTKRKKTNEQYSTKPKIDQYEANSTELLFVNDNFIKTIVWNISPSWVRTSIKY